MDVPSALSVTLAPISDFLSESMGIDGSAREEKNAAPEDRIHGVKNNAWHWAAVHEQALLEVRLA